MLKVKLFSLMPFLISCLFLSGAEWKVDPQKSVIIIPGKAVNPVRSAALELQKHFRLITGKEVSVQEGGKVERGIYPFYVGIIPEEDRNTLAPEEARWNVAPSGTYIYGEDFTPAKKGTRFNPDDIFRKGTRTGTFFGVSDFLEKQFGVLWIEPGDGGIIYTPDQFLTLKTGSGSWNPGTLFQREIRSGMNWNYYKRREPDLPPEFHLSKQEFDRKYRDVMFWLKRHKMGRSRVIRYGHAFTQWWDKYSKTHTGFFAMQKNGRRELGPGLKPDRSKLCVSNPAVHEKIVADWLESGAPETINVCENDSGGFCLCPACRRLDVPHPGEEFGTHLTDRYVYLANQVQRLAAKHRRDVSAVFYAYSCYREPPRREKVDPRIIIGFVPSMLEYEKVAGMFAAWKKAGAEKMFLRPNDQHVNTGLPMGFEKLLFDHFQLGIRNGIVGSDYDCMHNCWPATGIADYILARAHEDPSKSFGYWEKQYCSAFGGVSAEIMGYYRYWRNEVWDKRIAGNRDAILKRGLYGIFRRGLMWDIHKYYHPDDFDKTDAILRKAWKKAGKEKEKKQVADLMNANRHARLNYIALTAKPEQRLSAGRNLLSFRLKHKDDLNFFWPTVFGVEKTFGDISGTQIASKLKGFSEFRELPVRWLFQIDRENAGSGEHWEKYSFARIQATWDPVMVNTNWESQTSPHTPEPLKELLKNYDGVGWYAQKIVVPESWKGRKISLYFGAVDESCRVYLNGLFCGERIFTKSDDWQTPFAIPVDLQIDWKQKFQTVVVRVEDKAGNGGIWKPVYLVTE